MKQKLHIFMTLLLLLVCGGASFGQEEKTVQLVLSSSNKFATASGSKLTSNKVTWTVTTESGAIQNTYINSYKGQQFGTAKSIWAGNFSTSDIVGKIKKVTVAANTGGSATLSVKVGDVDYVSNTKAEVSVAKKTSGINSYAFDGDAEGKIVVSLKAQSAACYLGSITVTYVVSSGKTSTTLSFGEDYDGKTISTKVGEMLETPAALTPAVAGATITYGSSDKNVAEIDEDGIVYAYKEGTTTITASYAGDDTYAASSASYTLNVVDGRTATTLTFPNASYTFNLGSGVHEFTNIAELDPAEAGSVTYKSSDDNLAVVGDDGSVVVSTDKVGTATITATFAGNDTYAASEASYTITVNKAVADGVFDFSQPENYGYKKLTTGGTAMAAGTEVKAGNVTLTVLKKGTSDASWWFDGAWRIYKNSEHKLSVPEGYLITSVTIVPEGSKYAYYKIQGGAAGKDWTGASQEVSIVNDAEYNSRIKSITVKYTKLATLTTAASGFATYAADYDVNYSDAGLTAYAITLDEAKKTVKYTEATGVVPAGKAVLVKGEPKTDYTLTPATEDADDFTTDLQASDGKVTSENGLYYVFATVNGKSGFKILADGKTIPAKKGYLKLSTTSAKSFFELEGGEATGISEIEAEAANDNAAIYNLAGQRVSKSYKGIAIKNGKKFVK